MGKGAAGRYAPLATITIVLFLALAVLPSALNLPQTNPSTTLEYAPVPPADESLAPPGGNLSSLGLASSGTLGIAGDGALSGVGGGGAAGLGKNPTTKRCVGKPPRQSEDPLSPPCVAYFQGNNFGATYTGITGDEVRIVLYFECCNGPWTGTSRGEELDPQNSLWDLAKPGGDDSVWIRFSRVYQRYFNDRYQTYGRFAHFYVYFGRGPNTPETRKQDAADIWSMVKPFAVVSMASEGNEDVFLEGMAKQGVLNFGARMGREASFFQRYARLVWGYMPSVEVQADQYASYVCQKVVPNRASFSGDPGVNGQPRKLGLLYTSDPKQPGMRNFAALAKKKIQACGGQIVVEAAFKEAGYHTSTRNRDGAVTASGNIASFQQQGVTTILWAQGYEVEHTKAAARANYHPEWIVAGDGTHDGYSPSIWQDRTEWQNAWVITNSVLTPPQEQQQCYRAQLDANPSFPPADAGFGCRGTQYEDMRQLFTGIQVAGPKLSPESIDKGFHAIPSVESADPTLPACFYNPGDYTCVKDAAAMWWDPSGANDGGTAGVWRMAEGGKRHIANKWRSGDVLAEKDPDDPPNAFEGTYWFCC